MNVVMLFGYLGGDPEVRYSQSGTPFASVSLATSKKWTDKSTGELREKTEWHRIQCIGTLAETAGKYLHKGDPLIVQGELRTDKYTDKDGVERYVTKVVVKSMQMLPKRSASNGDDSPHQKPAAAAKAVKPAKPANEEQDEAPAFEDDDIPF